MPQALKQLARLAAAGACSASGLLPLVERRNRTCLTILCYHRVLPDEAKAAYFAAELAVTPDAFREQCRTLARHYDVWPLSQALDAWRNDALRGRPLAAITFDDGYGDNAVFAASILAELGLRATFFVVTGLIGTRQSPWYDRLARAYQHLERAGRRQAALRHAAEFGNGLHVLTAASLVARAKRMAPSERRRVTERLVAAVDPQAAGFEQDRLMNWEQVRDLAAAGHEIGSHSHTHEILTQLDDDELNDEICTSRDVLTERLAATPRAFCYPNGDYDERVVRIVQSAGYVSAVSIEPGINEPVCDSYRLKRRFIHEGRLAGPSGRASDTLLRMELCSLSDRVFRRGRRKAVPV